MKNTNSTFNEVKEQTITFIYNSIFKDFIYKTQDDAKTEMFFEQVRDIVPNEKGFFENWFRAFVSVSKNDGKNSCEYFTNALEELKKINEIEKTQIIEYLANFLQQGFAFFMYINDTENAKNFWQFGADKGLFAKPTTDNFYEKFFKRFNSKEQFWVQFSPKMFIDESKATEKALNDYKESAKTNDELLNSINEADLQKFEEIAKNTDFDTKKIAGVSPLYYTIQRKGSLKAGFSAFIEDLIQIQVSSMVSKLDLSNLPENMRNRQYLEIFHQMRATYEKSGLGKIMFNALFGKDDEIEQKIKNIEKILEIIIEKTSDVDSFTKDNGNKTQTNALLLSCEIGDTQTMQKLIEKGANVEKTLGFATFSMRYKDGKSISTEIPNSLIYRMISFGQFEALKFYITNFKDKAQKSMTEKTSKCDITPFVYLILNTLYNSKDEESYKKNKSLIDEYLPLFVEAGTKLDENTAFSSAKKLLGL